MTKCLGTSGNFNASVEVIILSLSNVIKGKLDGFEPVAIMIFFASSLMNADKSIFYFLDSK
jgi:hypothetical protein